VEKKKKSENTRFVLPTDGVTIFPPGAAWNDDEVKALIRVSKKIERKASDGKMGGIKKWNNAYPFYMNQDFGSVRLNANAGKVTCNPYYQKWTMFRRMVNDYNAFVSIDGEEVARADSAAPTGGGEEDGVVDERTLAYEESLAAKEEKKKAWLLKNVSRHHIEVIDYFNEKFPNSVAGEGIWCCFLFKDHKSKIISIFSLNSATRSSAFSPITASPPATSSTNSDICCLASKS
jgi:hypothetical protein